MHTFPVLLEGKEEAGQQLEGKVGSQPFFLCLGLKNIIW